MALVFVASGISDAQIEALMKASDPNGDGKLDVVLPGTGPVEAGAANPLEVGGPDQILLGEAGGFVPSVSLVIADEGSRTQVALFTDRDADGDQDLLILADRGPPSAFYRNDGPEFFGWQRGLTCDIPTYY